MRVHWSLRIEELVDEAILQLFGFDVDLRASSIHRIVHRCKVHISGWILPALYSWHVLLLFLQRDVLPVVSCVDSKHLLSRISCVESVNFFFTSLMAAMACQYLSM